MYPSMSAIVRLPTAAERSTVATRTRDSARSLRHPSQKAWHKAQELGSDDGHRRVAAKLRNAADKVDAGNPVLAVMPEIVQDDQRAARPAAQDRAIKVESVYDRTDIIGPQPRVTVCIARLFGEAMPAQIHRDEAMVTR